MQSTSTPKIISKSTVFLIVSLLLWFFALGRTMAQTPNNLITNGSFSDGNTGFKSEYFYSVDLVPEGNYTIGNNPKDYHGSFCKMDTEALRSPGRPEGSRGNMLIGNASGDASLKLWTQSPNLNANSDYSFSFWAASLAGNAKSLNFGFYVNCVQVGAAVTATSNCGWTKYTFQFNSGSLKKAELSIRNLSLERNGNDIAIDDITFYQEYPAVHYPIVNPFVWRGYTNDWFDADNWGSCTIPTCSDDVTIPAGAPNYPIITTNTHSSGLATVGSISIASGATLTIQQNIILNVCGDFNNAGTVVSNSGAVVAFTGSKPQMISTGSSFANLRINQTPASTVTAGNTLTVTESLMLNQGILITDKYEVSVTNANATAVTGHSKNAYVVGNLRRAVQNTAAYDYPVGDARRYQLIRMYITASLGAGVSSVLGYFTPSDASQGTGLPFKENNYNFHALAKGGYWHLMPNGTPQASARYDVEIPQSSLSGLLVNDITTTIVKRTNSSAPWSLAGSTAVIGVNGTVLPPVRRNGYSTFSEFTIVSGTPAPMPVEIGTFTATANGSAIQLRWSTVTEQNSDHFLVEASPDARNFTTVGQVKAKGESKTTVVYQFTDAEPRSGVSYYRLKEADRDGQVFYSAIVSAEVEAKAPSDAPELYPNPSDGRDTRLKTTYTGELAISIHTPFGKLVHAQQAAARGEEIPLDFGGRLPQGIYIVNVQGLNYTSQQKLVVK